MGLKLETDRLKPDKRTLVKVRRLARSRKARLAAVGFVAVALVGLGVFLLLQYRASTLGYTLNRLNQAVATRNVEELARRVDFVSLSHGLALVIAEATDRQNAEAVFSMEHDIQQMLLELFTGKAEKGEESRLPPGYTPPERQKAPLDDPVFDILKKPTHVVPPNLLEQLVARPFALQAEEGDLAVIETAVEHPQLGIELPVRLSLLRDPQTGWQVHDIANAPELVALFLDRVKQMEQDAQAAFEAENDRLLALMNTYYHVESCRAVLFPPDADDVVRLRLVLTGRNLGERELVASATMGELLDQDGAVIGTLRLENVRSVRAGDTFEHAWFYSFENRYPEVVAMLEAKSVSCRAIPATVSLGKGQLLYPRKLEDLPGVRIVE